MAVFSQFFGISSLPAKGIPGWTYYFDQRDVTSPSTNLAIISTNPFDSNGRFNPTIPADSGQFHLLKIP